MDRTAQTDEDLMMLVATADRHAFDVLVKRHLNRVYSLARCMVSRQADAEDVAQDAFTRVWVYGPRWEPGRAAFTTWLHRIVVNCCYDHLRKRSSTEGRQVEIPDTLSSADADSEAQMQGKQRRAEVREALQGLPERQRMAVTLCYFEGMTNIQAAEVMDIHIKALEGLLFRARRALRPVLEEKREGEAS